MQVILTSALEQGLLYSFMVLGVFLTFRVLDFPDLTVDGSLPLGAAVTATLITNGHSPFLATAAGVPPASSPGCVTGLLHMLLKSGSSDTNYGPKLLAGILTMTALYTVNLRIMGRSNIPLLGVQGVFEKIGAFLSVTMIVLEPHPRPGRHRARREVPARLVPAHRVRPHPAGHRRQRADDPRHGHQHPAHAHHRPGPRQRPRRAHGSLVAQQQGFADVGMGIGTIVAGLAGVIMGEVIFGERSISWVLFSVIGGSIVYRLLIAVSLRFGIAPTDLKLLTAALVVVALSVPTIRKKVVRA